MRLELERGDVIEHPLRIRKQHGQCANFYCLAVVTEVFNNELWGQSVSAQAMATSEGSWSVKAQVLCSDWRKVGHVAAV